MAEVTTLTLAVDSRQVASGKEALDQFARSGAKTETALGAMEKAAREAAKATGATAAATNAASRASASAAARMTRSTKQVGDATKLTAQQAQQLGFQLNDLFVQVASGGNPFTALIQQGSQLSGTFGGVGGAMRAILSTLTPLRVGLGLTAGSAATLGLAFIEGDRQSAELARTLTLTGNAAGLTEGRFNSLAKTISDATSTSIGSTRETLLALAGSGRISGESLAEAGKAAQLLSKVTGQSSNDIIKLFDTAADKVGQLAQELNGSYNFLTADQLRYIRTLEDQGQSQKALEVTLRALNARLGESAQNVGLLERAYNGLGRAVSSAYDSLLRIGRDTTPEDQLVEVRRQLAELQKAGQSAPLLFGASVEELRQQEAGLQELIRLQGRSATIAAQSAQQEQARIKFQEIVERNLSKQQRLERELQQIRALGARAGATEAQIQEQIARARERVADKKPALDLSGARLSSDLAKLKSDLDQLTSVYRSAEQILEATRSEGLLSEREYFDAKLSFIRLNEQAQIDALSAENARLQAEKGNARQRIELQRQIADNEARIAILRADGAAKAALLAKQEATAAKALERSYAEAEAAAQSFLDTLVLRQQRTLGGLGLGNQERDRQEGRQQIEDRYEDQRQRLASESRRGQIDEKRLADELARIERFQAAALASYDAYYEENLRKQRDFNVGASEALQNYIDESKNVGTQIEQALGNSFGRLEDVFTDFLTTGKLSFSDFANSVIAEINRITVRQTLGKLFESVGSKGSVLGDLAGAVFGSKGASEGSGEGGAVAATITSTTVSQTAAITSAIAASTASITGAISASGLGSAGASLSGGSSTSGTLGTLASFFGGFFADGGDPPMGKVSIVGERGPELFIPKNRGTIVPLQPASGSAQGGRVINVTNNFTISGPTSRQTQDQIAATAARAIQRAMARGTA